ncbi:MAG: hypothetical protein ABI891_13605 [Acidobacteriota bacterium]
MIFRILQTAIPFIWFGMVGAISFMEAPLKFRAPNITLALGLGIGKIVFQMLNRIEIVFALLMIISLFFARPATNFALYIFGTIFVLLLLQTVWLLPLLNIRAEQVIAGITAPYSYNHMIFIAFEVLKFILLFILGASLLKDNLRFN